MLLCVCMCVTFYSLPLQILPTGIGHISVFIGLCCVQMSTALYVPSSPSLKKNRVATIAAFFKTSLFFGFSRVRAPQVFDFPS